MHLREVGTMEQGMNLVLEGELSLLQNQVLSHSPTRAVAV